MKNLSVCLVLLFVVAITAIALPHPPPEVEIFSGTETFKAYFTVAVKATSVTGIDTVKINDETAIAAEDDEFYATLKLDYGENTITVTATAKDGAQTQKKFTLHRTRAKNNEVLKIVVTRVGNQSVSPIDNIITVSEQAVSIQGSVTGPNSVDRLKINGKSVMVDSNGNFMTALLLNYGKNPITVTAIDEVGNASEHAFSIFQRLDRTNKDFALFFATDEYSGAKDENGSWQNLKSSISDAEAVAKNLQDNYGFETKVFENLTKRELLNTLYAYRKDFDGTEYADDSQLLIFFVGHGYYDETGEEGYLITADTDALTVDPALASAVSYTKLRRQIDATTCRRILVLLDTSFSGTFDPGFEPLPAPVLKGPIKEGIDHPLLGNRLSLKPIKTILGLEARWYLTSAGTQFTMDGGTIGNSPFTTALLNALNTKGGDDFLLTLEEVWEEIQKSKDDPIYDKVTEIYKKRGIDFERPQPRKGQFGKRHSAESSFLFFPKP